MSTHVLSFLCEKISCEQCLTKNGLHMEKGKYMSLLWISEIFNLVSSAFAFFMVYISALGKKEFCFYKLLLVLFVFL